MQRVPAAFGLAAMCTSGTRWAQDGVPGSLQRCRSVGRGGLASNHTPLGEAAVAVSAYIVAHLHTHSASLKILTSRGNYLQNLNIRTEQVDFDEGEGTLWERNIDDLILRAVIWQNTH